MEKETTGETMDKGLKEMIFLKGLANQIDNMNYPRIENINNMLKLIGYKIVPNADK